MDNPLTGFIYRGLSPHKFTPMPGVHNRFEKDVGYDGALPTPLKLNVRA